MPGRVDSLRRGRRALPECRVKARNTSANSENRIHDETVARQSGFQGALVSGVTVYAYLAHPSAVRHFGGARVGETLATRWRVRSLYEKKGRAYVELDLPIVAEPAACPVTHVLHTAICRLSAPAR